MNFVTHLPRTTKGNDSIWVIVDRLTKCAHFLAINQKMSMDKLVELYVREVVRLHGCRLALYLTEIRDLLLVFGSRYR